MKSMNDLEPARKEEEAADGMECGLKRWGTKKWKDFPLFEKRKEKEKGGESDEKEKTNRKKK